MRYMLSFRLEKGIECTPSSSKFSSSPASCVLCLLYSLFDCLFLFWIMMIRTRVLAIRPVSLINSSVRSFGTTGCKLQSEDQKGWLSRISNSLMVRKIEAGKDSHSRLLADSQAIYEMQVHDVKVGSMDAYLNNLEKFTTEAQAKDSTLELVASWRVDVGDQDQVVNIWRYQEGYGKANETRKLIRTDSTLKTLMSDQEKLLRKRENQFMMSFSFWGHPQPAVRDSCYEMRSYVLKPGTMIEWGNNWARGINFRSNQVAGFFSQIGQLYVVHHVWHYKDLQSRKDVREDSWTKPGWDEIVAYTVPLIREMRSRWMLPNPFSPIRWANYRLCFNSYNRD